MTTIETPILKNSKSQIHFGTDGWRGIIGEEYTFENVRSVAHGVGQLFSSASGPKKNIFIGYDNRFRAVEFAQEAAYVLSQYRFTVHVLSSSVTSPFLSFVTWKEKAPFGAMMTASHNPAEYLGFKIKGSFGGSIPQETALQIEEKVHSLPEDLDFSFTRNGHPPFQISLLETHMTEYVRYLKKHIDTSLFQKSKKRVCFDPMYGPGGKMVEALFKSLKNPMEYTLLHNTVDPLFGGLHPEPIEAYLSELKTAVPKMNACAGFALDGDGDRLGVVDENGKYLTPQQTFALLLWYLVNVKGLRGKVPQAVSLGYLSERIAQDYNCPFEEIPVGFKYVAEKVLKGDVLAGGEESGGYAFGKTKRNTKPGSILPERDGLFSALLLLEMILSLNKNLSVILKEIENKYGASCYLRNDIPLSRPVRNKSEFIQKVQKQFPTKWLGLSIKEMRTLDGLKVVLEDGSWILMRPSGTEPLLRTYAEFPKMENSQKSLDKLATLVNSILDSQK